LKRYAEILKSQGDDKHKLFDVKFTSTWYSVETSYSRYENI
jgi:hypothetical protein